MSVAHASVGRVGGGRVLSNVSELCALGECLVHVSVVSESAQKMVECWASVSVVHTRVGRVFDVCVSVIKCAHESGENAGEWQQCCMSSASWSAQRRQRAARDGRQEAKRASSPMKCDGLGVRSAAATQRA